jgi:cellulose synthase/poly-beta-1,6-N-acetylglucosamine synthase-like glycosyltransferase
MNIIKVLTAIHFISIGGLALYGVHRIWMMVCWFNRPLRQKTVLPLPLPRKLPRVTVQIPLYNEPLVARRIIDAVAAFHWPSEKLEIQILDDSFDDTRRIVDEAAVCWSAKGVDMTVIRRSQRTGYKAGALAHGLIQAKGEFIAVFDADFVPQPDFLNKTVPYFNASDVGMVQAKWGFFNAGYSWLTRLQSLLLSAHFNVEHEVRFSRGLFFNFNGTAGIWRKTAIEAAGGWSSDTVTEDLDLSYRAQMAGWRFIYLNEVVVPSELPVTLSDFRCQQERWAKGAVQTAKKLLPRLFVSDWPLSVKMEATAHLLSNFCWVFGFLATVTLYPVMLNRVGIGVYQIFWIDLPLFCLTGIIILVFYTIFGWKTGQRHSILMLPFLPAASIGLAPFFSLAVAKGLATKGGIFNRTPKFGFLDNSPLKGINLTVHPDVLTSMTMNIPLFIYTLAPLVFSWRRGTWPAIPFLCLFPLGFSLVLTHDLRDLLTFIKIR